MDGRIEWRAPTKEGRGRAERTGGRCDRCSVEDGGRISLTFQDVRTFLDVRTKRLFGQGVSSSMGTSLVIEEGVILEVSLRAAAYVARDDDMRERNGAIAIVLGIRWALCIIQNYIYRQRRRYCQIRPVDGRSITYIRLVGNECHGNLLVPPTGAGYDAPKMRGEGGERFLLLEVGEREQVLKTNKTMRFQPPREKTLA